MIVHPTVEEPGSINAKAGAAASRLAAISPFARIASLLAYRPASRPLKLRPV